MAIVNPRKMVDRSSIPYAVQWFNANEGATGQWFPVGVTRGVTFSPGTDSTSTDRGIERYEEVERTSSDANTFSVDSDVGLGDGVVAAMNTLRKSGGNAHQLRLFQKGFKIRGVALSSSKKFKVDKKNATGGDGLGQVTFTGFTLAELGGFVNKNLGLVVNNAVPTATNLFVVQFVDYTVTDLNTKGYLNVYEYSLTTGLKDADPTLAELQAGTVDIIFPDCRVDLNASLDQDIRPNVSPGQSTRGSFQFTETSSPVERLGNVGTYWAEDMSL